MQNLLDTAITDPLFVAVTAEGIVELAAAPPLTEACGVPPSAQVRTETT